MVEPPGTLFKNIDAPATFRTIRENLPGETVWWEDLESKVHTL